MKILNKKPNVTIIIPAINEGAILKKVIDDCYTLDKYAVKVLVIIDSKVTPQTKKIAKMSKAKVLDIGQGRGKGTAVRLAIPHITSEFVIQIDADYQFVPREIPKLMRSLQNGFDVALGTRYQKGSKIELDSVSYLRLFGSYGLSFATSIVSFQRITDVMAGFKGFKTAVLRDLNPQVDHFGYEAELVIRAAQKGYKIINIPITYKKRNIGESNVSSIKHGMLVLQTIVTTALDRPKN